MARLDRAFSRQNGDEWPFDLAAVETHDASIAEITRRNGPIAGLVNNAGIASPKRGPFLDLAPEAFDHVMDVNLRGTVFFTQAVIRAMLEKPVKERRAIQFITSASAMLASPERLDYCMSKAGLAMFVKGLALAFAGKASTFRNPPRHHPDGDDGQRCRSL